MSENSDLLLCLWRSGNDDLCNMSFNSIDDLAVHVTNAHVQFAHVYTSVRKKYVCRWKNCPRAHKSFIARYKLVNHMRVHTGEKPFSCKYCQKTFTRSENLRIHERTHTGEKPFSCDHPGCGRAFANCSDRKKHSYMHKTEQEFVCKYPNCDLKYRHPSSYRKHVRTHHERGDQLPKEMSSSS